MLGGLKFPYSPGLTVWVAGIPPYLRVPFTGAKRNDETDILSIGALSIKERDTDPAFANDERSYFSFRDLCRISGQLDESLIQSINTCGAYFHQQEAQNQG